MNWPKSTALRGYSLIEMMAVIALISLMLLMVLGIHQSKHAQWRKHELAAEMMRFFEEARCLAMEKQEFLAIAFADASFPVTEQQGKVLGLFLRNEAENRMEKMQPFLELPAGLRFDFAGDHRGILHHERWNPEGLHLVPRWGFPWFHDGPPLELPYVLMSPIGTIIIPIKNTFREVPESSPGEENELTFSIIQDKNLSAHEVVSPAEWMRFQIRKSTGRLKVIEMMP